MVWKVYGAGPHRCAVAAPRHWKRGYLRVDSGSEMRLRCASHLEMHGCATRLSRCATAYPEASFPLAIPGQRTHRKQERLSTSSGVFWAESNFIYRCGCLTLGSSIRI